MAVAVIMLGVLSIFATVIAAIALAPIANELGTDIGGHWTNATTQATDARDNTFQAIIVLPIFLIVAIVTWMILTVTRRDFGEF